MARLQLRVHTGRRDPAQLPADDDALGEALFARVVTAAGKGLPRPAVLVLEAEQIRQYDAVPLLKRAAADRGRLLAAVCGQSIAECTAFAGTLTVRAGRAAQPLRALVVYVEWPDNRWWTAWQFLDEDGAPVGDAPQIRRAVDGYPRPGGMGGWFARARRESLRLNLEPVPRPGRQAGLDLVH